MTRRRRRRRRRRIPTTRDAPGYAGHLKMNPFEAFLVVLRLNELQPINPLDVGQHTIFFAFLTLEYVGKPPVLRILPE